VARKKYASEDIDDKKRFLFQKVNPSKAYEKASV